jgi:hypothetical protein
MPSDNPAIYAGADLVTNWYKRNLRILANVARITDFKAHDRVLLLIGAGHLAGAPRLKSPPLMPIAGSRSVVPCAQGGESGKPSSKGSTI